MEKKNIYNMSLTIEPEEHSISAKGTIKIYPKSETNILSFYLYKNFNIESLECNKAIKYYEIVEDVKPPLHVILESRQINICFENSIIRDESVNITIKYKGNMNKVIKYEINRVTEEWIELGMYSPWFPFTQSIDDAYFNVSLDIDSEYKVINSKIIEGVNVINQYNSFVDCAIIASNKFKTVNSIINDIRVSIFYILDEHRTIAEQICKDSTKILESYKKFGEIKKENISIVILPRNDGGGYCRNEIIVLDSSVSLQDELSSYHFIAHELAHLWWSKVKQWNSWEDWLNESFAEFSALLSLKENYGEKAFVNKINKYKERVAGLPAIKELIRGDEKAFSVLYIKGPLALYEIMNFIGEDKFYKFLNQVHLDNITSTESLMEVLNEIAGCQATNKLEKLLIE